MRGGYVADIDTDLPLKFISLHGRFVPLFKLGFFPYLSPACTAARLERQRHQLAVACDARGQRNLLLIDHLAVDVNLDQVIATRHVGKLKIAVVICEG